MRAARAALAAACLILTTAACDHRPAPLSQKEKQTVTELTANLKTRCVGRYLIDMPGEAWEFGSAKIQGVRIEAEAMTLDAWRQEVEQRETELTATRSRDAHPFLYAAGKGWGDHTYVFVHRGTIYEAPNRRYIEGNKWDRGYRFLLKIKTYDYTNPDRTSDPIVKQFDVVNAVPEKRDLVLSLMEKLRGRSPDEIPTEPGVCFAGGFLPAPAGDHEDIDAQFGLDRMKDVSFDISTTPDLRESTTLLQRTSGSGIHAVLKAVDGHVVRKGLVALAGLSAEEWLIEGRRPGDGRGTVFSLIANETTSEPSAPYLSLDLTTGGVHKVQGEYRNFDPPSLSTGEAVALWDAVSRTLRLRPGAL